LKENELVDEFLQKLLVAKTTKFDEEFERKSIEAMDSLNTSK
jgi:hypothetical protein